MGMAYKNSLYIDTALQATCIGLKTPDQTYHNIFEQSRGHAERVLPMVQEIMDQADLGFDDLDAILTTRGPGSFTGLRVSLSVVQTLKSTLNAPVFSLDTFDSIALSVDADQPLCVMLESKRKDFYIKSYGGNTPYQTPQTAMATDILNDLNGVPITGDGCERCIKETGYNGTVIDCRYGNPDMVLKAFYNDPSSSLFSQSVKPLYLRGADVSKPKAPLRKLAT
jgi:tRNA threonylcarbamoyladenosine biosynthesis protein TsaB